MKRGQIQMSLDSNDKLEEDASSFETSETTKKKRFSIEPNTANVLVVDDDYTSRRIAESLLHGAGYNSNRYSKLYLFQMSFL
jgi:PleD family two-component response regulator